MKPRPTSIINRLQLASGMLFALALNWAGQVLADSSSALLAMNSPDNPLVEIKTSRGSIFVEMYPDAAPVNVARFLDLSAGRVEFADQNTNTVYKPRYYDGMTFHRVIQALLIQAGSPHYNPLGAPTPLLNDEINADALGLHLEKVLLTDSTTNPLLALNDQEDFAEQVLKPLYKDMDINSAEALIEQQDQVIRRLQSMSIKQLYQLQGFNYTDSLSSHPIERGVMALANTGPNSNGAEFFISLTQANHLSGKYTAIGSVVEGMDIVDQIGSVAIDPLKAARTSTVIYSIRTVN